MKKIVNYYVIEEDDLEALSKETVAYIEAGWQPFGNLITFTFSDNPIYGQSSGIQYFVQPMVIYEN